MWESTSYEMLEDFTNNPKVAEQLLPVEAKRNDKEQITLLQLTSELSLIVVRFLDFLIIFDRERSR